MTDATAPDPALATNEFLERIPRDFAREHGLLAQGEQDGAVHLAVTTTTPAEAVWNTGVRLGRPVATRTVDAEALHKAIDTAYERTSGQTVATEPDEAEAGGHVIPTIAGEEDLDRLLAEADKDLLSTEGKAPLVRLVDRLLFTAVQRGASDLHIQPTADGVIVRHRVDGVLDQGHPLPQNFFRPLISRIKVMGRMDVAERLVPQDGRTTVRIGDRAIDVRVSTIPTAYGERVVLRLLDSARQLVDLPDLGMPGSIAVDFEAAARRSSGIILVTGPTGSGKTTTLYATLSKLNAGERNIMTIEDPIEYELSSVGIPISQSQVNLKKGVNFANGLRHILRQDPDVIMVGEIRDAETARIAIQASLTGHLVFTTLHTNDAISAVSRLIDLGIEPYLVAASLSAVLAQRLVRTRCPACAGPGAASCPVCAGSGYKGRTGVFELLMISDEVRRLVSAGASLAEIRTAANAAGMRTFAAEGQALIDGGRTTKAEVERVLNL